MGTRRGTLLLVARVVASGAMLAVLLSRFDLALLVPPRRQISSLAWVGAGLALTVLAAVLATVRWQRVLRALGVDVELPSLLSHTVAGDFVSNFLPSTVGGDVLRVARLAAVAPRQEAFASVVLERLTGFVVLPFLVLVALFGNPALRGLGTASRLALTLAVGTLVVLALVVALAGSNRVGARLVGHTNWLRFAGAVHLGLGRLRRQPVAVAAVLVAALAYQLTVVMAAWAGAHALGLDVGWSAAMAFVPVVAIAQSLPLSVNGIGLREGVLVVLLAPLGVATSQAVGLGLLIYAMNLVVSLLGAPAFAVGTRPVRAPARVTV